jgi:hypothetical protein
MPPINVHILARLDEQPAVLVVFVDPSVVGCIASEPDDLSDCLERQIECLLVKCFEKLASLLWAGVLACRR